jgi:hypothetical protein
MLATWIYLYRNRKDEEVFSRTSTMQHVDSNLKNPLKRRTILLKRATFYTLRVLEFMNTNKKKI